jgi:aminoglycoside 3-N-acetyltransferase
VEKGLEGIFLAIREIIGNNGTIVVPTFTFSFCRGEVFDIQKSQSKNGVFTEYIRKLTGSIRSHHGITSFSAIGKDAITMISTLDKTSYGPGSVPGNLRKGDCKVLQIGVPVISHTHYVERLVGVEYRYNKDFNGTIRNGSNEFEETFSLYVRRRDRKVKKLGFKDTRVQFFSSEFCQEIQFAYGLHRFFRVEDFISFTIDKLNNDNFCLIDKKEYLSSKN